jgi:hypothetical protein
MDLCSSEQTTRMRAAPDTSRMQIITRDSENSQKVQIAGASKTAQARALRDYRVAGYRRCRDGKNARSQRNRLSARGTVTGLDSRVSVTGTP